jgi:ATP-dependent helicase/nuclease subunit B
MRPFLKEVAEDLIARLGDNLQHSAIVFNNKRPAAYLQNHLGSILQRPFWSPSFYTIQELFALSSDLKIADPFTQFFTLFKVYNDLLQADGMKAMEPAKFYPIARIILSDFSQIDNDLVDAFKLFEELEDIAEIDLQFDYLTTEQQEFLRGFWRSYSEGKQKKQQEQFIRMWRRMPAIYEQYHEALKAKGFITMAQVYRKLAAGKDLSDFTAPFAKGKLVFVGFNALTQAEAVVFKRFQDQGKALFYFDTDTYYMDDHTQEAGLFLRKNLERTGLINALGESRALIKSAVKTVNVFQTQGHTAQAKILHQALKSDYPLLKDNAHAGQVALILADESLLLPLLQTIPTQYHDGEKNHPVNLNVSMGYPLAASSIFGLADLWLCVQAQMNEAQKDSVNFKEVEAFLSHPLTGVTEKMRDKIQQKLIDEQLVEVPVSRLMGQKGLLALFFTPVTLAAEATSAFQEILKYILEHQLAQKTLKQTEADLFVATLKELNRLHDTLSEHLSSTAAVPVAEQASVDQRRHVQKELSFVLSLIQKAIQGIAVPLSGEPLQGIQVMGLLESRNLDFEHIYILGANEGVLPQSTISTSFIPDGIRRAHGLPVIENQDAISAYMFYRLLQRAENISLVYNAQTDERNTGEPSRFLRQLEYESGYQFNYFAQQQEIATENRIPVQIKKDKQVMFLLKKYLTGEQRLSATALTTYVDCPLQFFYKYVARIEEPKEVVENVEANIVGLMLHWMLETFYRELMRADAVMSKERIAEHRKTIPRLAERAFARIVFNDEQHAVNHNGMQKVVLAIVKEYAEIILDQDEAHAPFKILALEKKDQINFDFFVDGVKQCITLHGIIDRIDEKDGITRIVDYKTGSDDLRFSSIEEVFQTNGKKLNKALIQTLFYTHVYEQANTKERVEPNIYSIRNMRTEGAYFMEGRGKTRLAGDRLADIKLEFVELLRKKLGELFDEHTPFTPTTNENSFTYSPYITLCGM